jgi:hypothetical protein
MSFLGETKTLTDESKITKLVLSQKPLRWTDDPSATRFAHYLRE